VTGNPERLMQNRPNCHLVGYRNAVELLERRENGDRFVFDGVFDVS